MWDSFLERWQQRHRGKRQHHNLLQSLPQHPWRGSPQSVERPACRDAPGTAERVVYREILATVERPWTEVGYKILDRGSIEWIFQKIPNVVIASAQIAPFVRKCLTFPHLGLSVFSRSYLATVSCKQGNSLSKAGFNNWASLINPTLSKGP